MYNPFLAYFLTQIGVSGAKFLAVKNAQIPWYYWIYRVNRWATASSSVIPAALAVYPVLSCIQPIWQNSRYHL